MDDRRLHPWLRHSDYWILRQLRNHLQDVIRLHIVGQGGLVLVDYGCGDMPYRPLFEPHLAQYVGADFPGNRNASLHISEAGVVDMPSGSADIVLSTQVLEHVADPAAYLREARRLLKPGGLLILSTHGHFMYHGSPEDFWRWTPPGLRRLVEASGFETVGCHGIMGLASSAVQLFQDAFFTRLPRLLRPAFGVMMQSLVILFDLLASQRDRDTKDATVIVICARPAS